MGKLDEKVAIVIGGGSGLGRAIALSLAKEGSTIIVAARTKSQIEETVNQVKDVSGNARAIAVDVTVTLQVDNLVQEVIESFGKIDILINCQGYNVLKPTTETTEEEWDKVFNTNLKSVYQICKAVLPHMRKQGGGHIFNVASRAAMWYPGRVILPLYKPSKMGLIGFSQTLAEENRSYNIKVNILAPAPMDTPMRWRDTPNFDRNKTISTENVANLVTFLATWSDTYMTEVLIPCSVNYP